MHITTTKRPATGSAPNNSNNNTNRKKEKGPRVNEEIRVPQIRLIGDDGEQYGVVSIDEARKLSFEKQLDLVEVSPNASPPVVKLIDFGKFKYQLQKKAAEAKKKQAVIALKEIQFRPNIEKHDVEVKLKKAEQFIEQGDKIKIIMQFRGREMAYQEMGMEKFRSFLEKVVAFGATVESDPKFMGNRIIAMVASNNKKTK